MIGYIGSPDWAKISNPKAIAISYCLAEMKFYEDWGRHNRIVWKAWQNTAIVFGSIATIIAVLPLEQMVSTPKDTTWLVGLLRAIPAAITTVAATVLGIYNFKGEHLRQGVTHDALQGELAKFLVAAKPYDNADPSLNAAAFVNSIRLVIGSELQRWYAQFANPNDGKDGSSKTDKDAHKPEENPA